MHPPGETVKKPITVCRNGKTRSVRKEMFNKKRAGRWIPRASGLSLFYF
jgi:hypothetical protein